MVKWDRIQPELMQIAKLYNAPSVSLFNVLGRSQQSLQTTRLVLTVLRKLMGDNPDMADSEATGQYLDAMIAALDRCDDGVGRVRSLVNKSLSFFWSS